MAAALRLWLVIAALWVSVGAAWAQQEPDYQSWDALAERVENVLAVGAASDAALELLRDQVTSWRDTFLKRKDSGSYRIATLQRRLAALPPPPQDGDTELDTVTQAREALQSQLAQLQEPAVRAQLAFDHADGLVREIDESLRDRQASVLIERLPLPVNPLNWIAPLAEVTRLGTAVPSEIVGLFGSEDARRSLLRNLPGSLLIGLLGIWLLGRGGHWSNSVIEAGQGMSRAATALIAESFGALLQLALPLAGLFLLLSAVGQSGLLGETGTILFRSLSRAAVLAILGYWLVARIYPVGVEAGTAKSLVLPARLTGFARRSAVLLVTVLAMHSAIAGLAGALQFSDLTAGYLTGALVLPTAWAIYRLGRLYRLVNIAPAPTVSGGRGRRQPGLSDVGDQRVGAGWRGCWPSAHRSPRWSAISTSPSR